ncbi:hypothetical protein AKJ55_00845 [candidate division MSBL1 archaeon SCGC-AAA382M17]|uniref:A-type ATP synthase subunit F n=1 Tax=candidate division MSBL1 archaeon SCGC-AAA382M17 TaxID=1698284 RepID=A0ABR5TJS1_9EURY|nr:hypothetical protein AKJ55_00845 [candidate division MSBL1 archaeon SCGC-AAA382M17]
MKIVSITDSTTAKGLELAGVNEVFEAEDGKKTEKILEKELENEEVGIIIITENLAEDASKNLDELKEEKMSLTPIIIEIPSREGPIPERREIIDKLVKRAVGIKVKG